MNSKSALALSCLQSGFPALTEALGATHAESASICLDEMGHSLTTDIRVEESNNVYELIRLDVTDTMKRAYADLDNATNYGACAVAFLLARAELGYLVIEQAKRGTGFDYWCSKVDDPNALPFQNAARLEVSGILSATDVQLRRRLKEKLAQPEKSDSTGLPVVAVVVDFAQPRARIGQR